MAQACIASTQSVALSQDGVGTLRADALVSPVNNNTLFATAAGLATHPQNVVYGWPFGGDDLYNAAVALAPSSGYIGYGPEIFAQTQTGGVGCVLALVEMEIQAGYGGGTLNPFSGIHFNLQVSNDHVNWVTIAEQSYNSPVNQTVRWKASASYPICWADGGLHNLWARMLVAAGNFGSGENITIQFTHKRRITLIY